MKLDVKSLCSILVPLVVLVSSVTVLLSPKKNPFFMVIGDVALILLVFFSSRLLAKNIPSNLKATSGACFAALQIQLTLFTLFLLLLDYLGGYRLCHFIILALPLVPFAYLYACITLGKLSYRSIMRLFRPKRRGPAIVGALGVSMLITALVLKLAPSFVHGVRDRFRYHVGHDKLRAFAIDVNRLSDEGIVLPRKLETLPHEDQERWDKLARKYPFVKWQSDLSYVSLTNTTAGMWWGSGLIGTWGFIVALDGKAQKPSDALVCLEADDDIIFYYGE